MVPRFEYYPTRSVDEALTLLAEREGSEVVAGATNTLVDARARRKIPKAVIDINRLGDLRYARRDDGTIRLGARTTLTDCFSLPFFAEEAPVLEMMAAEFAGTLIRNRATLAGNIAYASPAADVVPPLLALGATIAVTSKARGSRALLLADFILGPRKTALAQDEIITELAFPADGETKSGYFKFALRNAMAISLVSGAVVLRMEGKRIREAGLALGAVAPKPYRVTQAEELLKGQAPTDALIREVARVAAATATPISDIRASAEYRREMTEVMTRRIIERALSS
ncbi:MAG: xanthine dehydrogenase family protein subunit M [Chloroflexi bacterium]|nr:xanthine dehydrogenase family protein subunit M [Chloroflexota bacterium]MBI3762654.1 xanthine dehydrogenase family protein subunit M [Chloroflexota bacterium]